ncbi:hypothetical protein LIER_38999 [Lithospermum erythrorhizon]|uniref:Retroviral polymerase SH3-like domain-containing protein n=1 Tax=Lithospermum erythrorhizon TaxID=34254 RepID=A0AAV3QBD0_LITER
MFRQDTKYFLTEVEDYSRCTWTVLLSFKTRVLNVVKNLLKMIEMQFDKKGYPYDHKGYKLLNLKDNTLIVSRDERFHEDLFPFDSNFKQSSLVPLDNSVIDDIFYRENVGYNLDEVAKEQASEIQTAHGSHRNRKLLVWLSDYVADMCNHTGSHVAYSIEHSAFVTNINQDQEPYSYKHAKDKARWIQAMKAEIEAFEVNDT